MLATTNDTLELKFSISQGRSLRNVENVKWNWRELLERLSRSDEDGLTLAQFKERPKDWQAKKKNNGYFVGGQFKLGIRHKNLMRPRQIITFDIDEGAPRLLAALRAGTSGLGDTEYAVYSTKTHGNGAIKLRVVIPLGKLLPHEHFQPASRVLAESLDVSMRAVDPVSFKPSQLMYWPAHCADIEPIFFHHQGPLMDVDDRLAAWKASWGDWSDLGKLPRSPRERQLIENEVAQSANPLDKRGIVGAFCRRYDIHEAIAEFLSEIYEPSEYDQNGVPSRYSFLGGTSSNGFVVYDNGLKAHSHHSSDPCADMNVNAFDLVRIHRFGHLDGNREPEDDPRQMRSFKAMELMLLEDADVKRELREGNYGISPADIDDSLEADEPEEVTSDEIPDSVFEIKPGKVDDDDWMDGLSQNQKGIIDSKYPNIVLILDHDPMFRGKFGYNEFTGTECLIGRVRSRSLNVDIAPRKGQTFTPLEDYHINEVRLILEAKRGPGRTGWGTSVNERDMQAAISKVCREHTFHPIRDKLAGLVSDGRRIYDRLFIEVCHAPDTLYYRTAAKYFLTAAVARVFSPGTKWDTSPVLIGPTNIGKSTFVQRLGTKAWSTSNAGFYDDTQKRVEATEGFWFVEHAELQHLRSAKTDDARKATASQGYDTHRDPYARRKRDRPKQYVTVGTVEEANFLRAYDRRTWPVFCGNKKLNLDWITDNWNQIFAEAVANYRTLLAAGHDPDYLPIFLTGEAEAEHRQLQTKNVIETEIPALTGIVSAWLDEPVPVNQAKCGSSFQDKADDALDDEKLVQRDRTCLMEVHERALGRPLDRYDRKAATLAGEIMRAVSGWIEGQMIRAGAYKRQRGWFRSE